MTWGRKTGGRKKGTLNKIKKPRAQTRTPRSWCPERADTIKALRAP
jgi:hypothetical protein